MANAYIKLVPASSTQTMSLSELKDLFTYYKEITSKTGSQLEWEYSDAAFPYVISQEKDADNWFYLKSSDSRYNTIIIGIGKEEIQDEGSAETREQTYIQVTLPQASTHGDKGKANEFCKFLARKLEGELHLFNGRVMYYYKRK